MQMKNPARIALAIISPLSVDLPATSWRLNEIVRRCESHAVTQSCPLGSEKPTLHWICFWALWLAWAPQLYKLFTPLDGHSETPFCSLTSWIPSVLLDHKIQLVLHNLSLQRETPEDDFLLYGSPQKWISKMGSVMTFRTNIDWKKRRESPGAAACAVFVVRDNVCTAQCRGTHILPTCLKVITCSISTSTDVCQVQ